MAILSSSESISRTSSSHQVPLVIISQPQPGPITGQNSSPASPVMSGQGDADAAVDSTVDLVLELENIANDTEESLSSTTVTSLPVVDGPSASGATPTSREDSAVRASFVVRAIKVLGFGRLFSSPFKCFHFWISESCERDYSANTTGGVFVGREDRRASTGSGAFTR